MHHCTSAPRPYIHVKAIRSRTVARMMSPHLPTIQHYVQFECMHACMHDLHGHLAARNSPVTASSSVIPQNEATLAGDTVAYALDIRSISCCRVLSMIASINGFSCALHWKP
eukprot:363801-Chlamydomonas_euryale.AAC.9